MNRTSILGRKLIYLFVILAMLIPLYLLGQPAGGEGDLGGKLSEMRHQYNMAESDLGEISPASETMKLASLGMRGVAATLLWNKAHRYRVLHEWDRLKATLNNIALLQPHFDKVWEHQAHNLAYNVSTEFDDYRQRYEMVREGTEFLTRGVRQNRNAPRLIWYTGWFYGQKMGMSDEKRQFRRLFADDKVLHDSLLEENIAVNASDALGPLGKPDNWLVGRLWLNHGYSLVVDQGVPIRRQTPLNFFETGPKWRFKHAEAIESEGILDARAENAWELAAKDWEFFGNRDIPTTSPFTIKLAHLDTLISRRESKRERFREITGQAYEDARQVLVDKMTPNSRKLWEQSPEEMTHIEREMREQVAESLIPNFKSVANNSPPVARLEALNLVSELNDLDEKILKTRGYRTQINYPYWETLAIAEQEHRTVEARRLVYEAEQANDRAQLDEAIRYYEEAFKIWAEVFDDYPILTIDDSAQDLFASIRRYMVAIDSQEVSDDFPLKTFVEMMGEYGQIDSMVYEQIRSEALKSREARQKELAEEERKREAEAEAEKSPEAKQEETKASENAADVKEDAAETKGQAEEEGKDNPEPAKDNPEEATANPEEAVGTEQPAEQAEPADPTSEADDAGKLDNGVGSDDAK